MKNKKLAVGLGIVALVVLIQLVPVSRTNPAQRDVPPGTPEQLQVLRRACYDCHSNETKWPWYSYVAPISWLVAHDVNEGREALNLSEWTTVANTKRRDKHRKESIKEVEEGEMPMPIYVFLHPEAKLSPQDVALIREWSNAVTTVEAGSEQASDGHEGHQH